MINQTELKILTKHTRNNLWILLNILKDIISNERKANQFCLTHKISNFNIDTLLIKENVLYYCNQQNIEIIYNLPHVTIENMDNFRIENSKYYHVFNALNKSIFNNELQFNLVQKENSQTFWFVVYLETN